MYSYSRVQKRPGPLFREGGAGPLEYIYLSSYCRKYSSSLFCNLIDLEFNDVAKMFVRRTIASYLFWKLSYRASLVIA